MTALGPWGDASFEGRVEQGLPALRHPWIMARGDIEEVEPSYKPIIGRSDAIIPPTLRRKPLRAKHGKIVTQFQYARKGIITPEMEFIAIRENLGREQTATVSPRFDSPLTRRRIIWRKIFQPT